MKTTITTLMIGAMALTSHAADCHSKANKTIVETAVAAGSFKTLAAALGAADLANVLNGKGPFTVFAPTDAAFAKLPKGTVEDLLKPENKSKLQAILKYHVIAGQVGLSTAVKAGQADTLQGAPLSIKFKDAKVSVNGATLQTADLKTSNGIIHVIDSVLLPPAPQNDIASVAKKAGQFNTLLAAVNAAGLNSVLTGKNSVTVLAPTDAAFKLLPKGTVESLLRPENKDKLQAILSTHVIKGSVSAGTALNVGTAKSVNAEALKFGISNGTFNVNGATIIKTDIKCDNGIIHVIDAVLLPTMKSTVQKDPIRLIESAINKGVPAFNHGNPAKCAQIYMTCAKMLVNSGNLNCSTRNQLKMVTAKAEKTQCVTTRAWILREGIDHVYTVVSKKK